MANIFEKFKVREPIEQMTGTQVPYTRRELSFTITTSHLWCAIVGAFLAALLTYLSIRGSVIAALAAPDCAPDNIRIIRFDGAFERICMPIDLAVAKGIVPTKLPLSKQQ